MRKLISILIVVFSLTVTAGEKIDKTLKVSSDGVVKINVISGDIKVETWKKSEIRVVGELDDDLEKFVFEVNDNETIIQVKLEEKHFNRNHQGSILNIFVPIKSTIRADGVATDYKVTGVQGGVIIESVSGKVSLKEITNEIEIESVSGDVNVSDSQAEIEIETVSGSIIVDLKASVVDLSSVSGDVTASIDKTSEVEISAVSGDIDLSMELLKGGEIEIETVSGDVSAKLKGKINARFYLTTGGGGEIQNSLSKDKPVSSFAGTENLKMKIGDGSGDVEISTISGKISISH